MMRTPILPKKHLCSDRGYILIATAGALALVTLLATASYVLARATLKDSTITSNQNRAFQLAASAADYELTLFEKGGLLETGDRWLPSGEKYYLDYSDGSFDGKYRIEVTATSGEAKETVVVGYRSHDLSDAFVSGGGDFFKGSHLNTAQSILIGPMYLAIPKKDTIAVKSGTQFFDGILNVAGGKLDIKNGYFAMLKSDGTEDGGEKYEVRTDVTETQALEWENNDKIGRPNVELDPFVIKPPEIDSKYKDSLKESADLVVNGDLTIPVPLSEQSDTTKYEGFVLPLAESKWSNLEKYPGKKILDLSQGTKEKPFVIYVKGKATINAVVGAYKGNFILYAEDGIDCLGRLVPEDFLNPSLGGTSFDGEKTVPIFETKYDVTVGYPKSERVPRIRKNYCASLISPKNIKFYWASGDNSNTKFSFAGACYSGHTVMFYESMRGSIIARETISPTDPDGSGTDKLKKAVLATQGDLRDMLPEKVSQLMKKVTYLDYWRRFSPE